MKRLLQFFTLLALALVGGAQTALAEETTEWLTVKSWNLKTLSWTKETGFGTNTITINKVACTYCTGALEGLALQGGTGTSWTVNSSGLTQGNGGRNIAILDLKAGDVVNISTATTLSSIVNGTGETYTGDCSFTVTLDGAFGFNTTRGAYISKIEVIREKKAGVCEKPGYNLSAAGTSRKFTLSCMTGDAVIYYSETELAVGDDGWKVYTSEVTTEAENIYAYAKTADATSEVISFKTGAGAAIKLNAPVISRDSYSGGNYIVSFSSTQTDLSVVPSSVAYSYSIDGGEFQTGANAKVAEGSTITVVATSDGYDNSEKVAWTSKSRPTDLTQIWKQDYTNLTSVTGDGAYGVVLSSDAAFSCNDKDFYNITGYNGGNGNIDVVVNDNVGLNTSENFYLRCNGNNSGILQNKKTGYLGIKNLLPGQTIIITVSNVPLRADYGVTLEEGMSTSSEYYFTATGTTASIVVPNGTYNYVKTIEVKGKTETITLPADYTYSTFCSTKALDFTDNSDVEAYIAQVENDGVTVTLTKVEQVPAGEGVILKKTGDNTTAAVKVLASAEALSNTALVGVTEANTVSLETLAAAGNAYVLVSDEKFSKVSEGASGYISAGKAYLEYIPVAGASVNSLRISFGEPTAVADVEAKQETGDNAIYNVQGIRVSKPTAPGMYIMNGKAFIVK